MPATRWCNCITCRYNDSATDTANAIHECHKLESQLSNLWLWPLLWKVCIKYEILPDICRLPVLLMPNMFINMLDYFFASSKSSISQIYHHLIQKCEVSREWQLWKMQYLVVWPQHCHGGVIHESIVMLSWVVEVGWAVIPLWFNLNMSILLMEWFKRRTIHCNW